MGRAGIDLPCQLGTFQRFVPAVFESKNVRLTTRYPSVLAKYALGTLQTLVCASEVAKKRPSHRVRSKPKRLHLWILSAEIRICFELSQVVQQSRPAAPDMICEIAHARIARITLIRRSK